MPNFKKNPSPAMKRTPYKMKGYSYPGTSPMRGCDPGDTECGDFRVNLKGTKLSRWLQDQKRKIKNITRRKRSKVKEMNYADSKGGSHKTVRHL